MLKVSMSLIGTIFHFLSLFQSSGVVRSSSGVFMPIMEKPEVAFDLLDSVCLSLDLQMKEAFDLILNVSADDFYDEVGVYL